MKAKMAGLSNERWSTLLSESKPVLGQNCDQETNMNDYTMDDLSGKLIVSPFLLHLEKSEGVLVTLKFDGMICYEV